MLNKGKIWLLGKMNKITCGLLYSEILYGNERYQPSNNMDITKIMLNKRRHSTVYMVVLHLQNAQTKLELNPTHLGMPTAVAKSHWRAKKWKAKKSEAHGYFSLVRKEHDWEGLHEGLILGVGYILVFYLGGGFIYSLYFL